MGPSFRADVWTVLEHEPDLSIADAARKASCSFATAWQTARDFRLLRAAGVRGFQLRPAGAGYVAASASASRRPTPEASVQAAAPPGRGRPRAEGLGPLPAHFQIVRSSSMKARPWSAPERLAAAWAWDEERAAIMLL